MECLQEANLQDRFYSWTTQQLVGSEDPSTGWEVRTVPPGAVAPLQRLSLVVGGLGWDMAGRHWLTQCLWYWTGLEEIERAGELCGITAESH